MADRFRREDAELFRRMRRPIPSLDGVSLVDLLARGDTPALLAVCRDMFRFDSGTRLSMALLRDTIPDVHVWRRITDPAWTDPLDPSFAQRQGGRWNPPGSFPTLYLNEDTATRAPESPRLHRQVAV